MRTRSRIFSNYEHWVSDKDPAADFREERHYGPQHRRMYISGEANKLTVDDLSREKLLVKRPHSNTLWSKTRTHMSGAAFLTPTTCWAVAMLVVMLALILIRLRVVRPQ
ncbi:hypothetical protein BDV59DRAFT_186815 [Aspergillus ambiguus]|uniref:uncharacterized protein n=1 Tax=Aspergillus ambiguus TaxID=176160 RepID=UPI003CCC981B